MRINLKAPSFARRLLTMMGKKKQKPMYLRVRLPAIKKIGGWHQPAKGGKYHRERQKEKTRHEVEAEP